MRAPPPAWCGCAAENNDARTDPRRTRRARPRSKGDEMSDPTEEPRAFWEQFYGEKDRTWSGRVNPRLVEEAGELTPGRALDLGCGEGADAVWLAERGWQVVAVDISATALQRARDLADDRNVGSRIRLERH